MLGILAGMDQKDSCSGLHKASFLVLHLALCCPIVQENWIMWDLASIFLRPLVSGSHLFELLPEKYRVAYFPGDDSRNGFSIQHFSWFNSEYMFGISLRGFLEEFHAFLREGRTFGS